MTGRRARSTIVRWAAVLAVICVCLILYVRTFHPGFRSSAVPASTPDGAVLYLALHGVPLEGFGIFHCADGYGLERHYPGDDRPILVDNCAPPAGNSTETIIRRGGINLRLANRQPGDDLAKRVDLAFRNFPNGP